jgi:hypothetical protein
MTDGERKELECIRARLQRLHSLQRRIAVTIAALDARQQVLAILAWEHEFSYKLRRDPQLFTDQEADQLPLLRPLQP